MLLVARLSQAEELALEAMFASGIVFEASEILLQTSVGVGVAVGDVDAVIVMFEAQREGETAVVASELPLHVIGVVADFGALSHPSYTLAECSFL